MLMGKLSVNRFEWRAATLGRGGREALWAGRCCSSVGGKDILLEEEESSDDVSP